MKHLALAAALILLPALPARADWLADAWSPDTVVRTGGPAITLSDTGGIVVLPAAALAAARRAGLTAKQALTAFLERYIQHCSDLLDADQPHAGLVVALSLTRATTLSGLFVTDDEEQTFRIDYVPARRAVCTGEVPTS
ncbi:MAG: hypothetical protein KGL39_41560 [Patescibacteria group bacterium]|nr:hypothetical protein [Patescibacteria group bacterium]